MTKKMTTVAMLALMVSGCAVGFSSSTATESYILDTKTGQLCIEGRNDCHSLSLIGPSYQEHIIAKGYQLPAKTYRWSSSDLLQLLLQPPGNLYQPEKLSAHQYRLPPVFAVHSVWDVLAWEQYILYERNDKFDLTERPIPRRF